MSEAIGRRLRPEIRQRLAKAAIALAKKYGVDMPIIEEVNCVLFEDKPAKEAVRELMMRDRRAEHSALEWEA